jgi:hypothetical protein
LLPHTAGKAGVPREAIYAAEQGFITSRNRFVSREEGSALQRAAGIPSAQTGAPPSDMLFSEDLYLRSTKGMPLSRSPGAVPEARPQETTKDDLGVRRDISALSPERSTAPTERR